MLNSQAPDTDCMQPINLYIVKMNGEIGKHRKTCFHSDYICHIRLLNQQ
jgi:hypothetical protein